MLIYKVRQHADFQVMSNLLSPVETASFVSYKFLNMTAETFFLCHFGLLCRDLTHKLLLFCSLEWLLMPLNVIKGSRVQALLKAAKPMSNWLNHSPVAQKSLDKGQLINSHSVLL